MYIKDIFNNRLQQNTFSFGSKNILPFLLMCCSIFFGCNDLDKPIDKRVEITICGDQSFFQKHLRANQALLGLDDLTQGFDSLQLRVWHDFSFSDSLEVFIVKKEPGSKWSARMIRFPKKPKSTMVGYREKMSDNGHEIWSELNAKGINECVGMDSEMLGRYADGEIAVIEIATKGTYRICTSESSIGWMSNMDHEITKRMNEVLLTLWHHLGFPD